MIDFSNPVIIWSIIGVLLIFVELLAPGFVIFFFGLGSFTVALIYYLFSGITINAQLIIFLIASILYLVILREFCKKIFTGFLTSKDEMPKNIDSNIGEEVTVVQDITSEKPGKVDFHGSQWKAISDETIKAGNIAIITEQKKHNINCKK